MPPPGGRAPLPTPITEPRAGGDAPTRAAVILPWEQPAHGDNGVDSGRAAEARLAEAVGLAASIGLVVVHTSLLKLRARRPATLIGSGQMEAEKLALQGEGVAVAIVDAALSPVQQRNLERAWNVKVIDRTGLILDIFG